MSEHAWEVALDVERKRAEKAEAEAAAMREALSLCLSVIRRPDNGVHYCRWCSGHPGAHAEGCAYVEHCDAIDKARAAASALLPPPVVRSTT